MIKTYKITILCAFYFSLTCFAFHFYSILPILENWALQRWKIIILKIMKKELSFFHKLKCSNSYISVSGWFKPWRFQTYIIWSNRIHSLKYQRSLTLDWKDTGIGKSEFVAKTQFLWNLLKIRRGLVLINETCSTIT